MFRGYELRDIFIDDEDRNKFLSTFKEKSECENFPVYAYCLMGICFMTGLKANLLKQMPICLKP